jgi:hypothetical protein
MTQSQFIFLFLAKKMLVLFSGPKTFAFYIDGTSNKVFDIDFEWYRLAVETHTNSKWN